MPDETQTGVLRGIVLALVVTLIVLPLPAVLEIAPMRGETSAELRLYTAAGTGLLLALPLVFCIAAFARFRFASPPDIHGSATSAGTDRARMLQAILQNTLEQVVLAAIVHGIWVMIAPVHWLSVSSAAALLLIIGRILFARGYSKGAPSRAFGFGLTFYPSVLLLITCPILLVNGH